MKIISNSKMCLFLWTIFLWTTCKNSSTDSFSPILIPIKAEDKWGYINSEGKYEINPQFTSADYFVENLALVSSSIKYGFIDEKGKYVVNPQYKYALNFSEGLACVVPENGKIKYIDKEGQLKFELKDAEYAGSFHNGFAKVKIKNKWGFIDKTGNVVITPQFDLVIDFTEQRTAFMNKNDKKEKLCGFIDNAGKVIISAQFKSVQPFSEGLSAVSNDGKRFGFIDKTGKYVINPQFDTVTSFFKGIAGIKVEKYWGFISKEGNIIVKPQFDNILLPPANGFIAAKSDNKWGYLNDEGKYIINPQFDKAANFLGDIAIVEQSGKTGIIDADGKYIANPQFQDYVSPFYFSAFGTGYSFAQLETDYFDPYLFADKILDNNKFFQSDTNTTVEYISLLFNPGDKSISQKAITIKKNDILKTEFSAKDIQTKDITIYFKENIFGLENQYEDYKDYWGETRKRVVGSTKIFNKEIKVKGIKATIELKNISKEDKKNLERAKTLAKAVSEKISAVFDLREIHDPEFDKENEIYLTHAGNQYFSSVKFYKPYSYYYYTEKQNYEVEVYLSFDIAENEKKAEYIKKLQAKNKF